MRNFLSKLFCNKKCNNLKTSFSTLDSRILAEFLSHLEIDQIGGWKWVFLHLEGWKTTIYHIYTLILQCSWRYMHFLENSMFVLNAYFCCELNFVAILRSKLRFLLRNTGRKNLAGGGSGQNNALSTCRIPLEFLHQWLHLILNVFTPISLGLKLTEWLCEKIP